MRCPFCGHDDSRVVDSREVDDGIRRRRECLGCRGRFTTYERINPVSLFVIKKDRRREAYDRAKILAGVRKACEKRPLAADRVEHLVDEVEAELFAMGKAEVPSRAIGDMVMRRLRALDQIAYIRFASVYRQFTDITVLKEEVDSLLGSPEQAPGEAQLPLIPEEGLGVTAQRGRDAR